MKMIFLKRYKRFINNKQRTVYIYDMIYGFTSGRNINNLTYHANYSQANRIVIEYSTIFYRNINVLYIRFQICKINLYIYMHADNKSYSFTVRKTTSLPSGIKQTISYKRSDKHDKERIILKFPRFAG